MNNEPFTLSSSGAVATVTLSKPDSGNRLMSEELITLGAAIKSAGQKADIKAVVVRARGDSFCLGRTPAPADKAPKTAEEVRDRVTAPILGLYADVRATPVPVIAVVQGEARGFGCAFVGQCDLAIASVDASFSLPEMDGNLPPTLAISAVLGKVPPKRVLQMVYTRRRIGAKEALEIGLISEVVARPELDASVESLLSCLTDRKRSALCAIKEYMAVAPYTDPAASARLASNILSVSLSSPGEI